jgi:hypothetical protein
VIGWFPACLGTFFFGGGRLCFLSSLYLGALRGGLGWEAQLVHGICTSRKILWKGVQFLVQGFGGILKLLQGLQLNGNSKVVSVFDFRNGKNKVLF